MAWCKFSTEGLHKHLPPTESPFMAMVQKIEPRDGKTAFSCPAHCWDGTLGGRRLTCATRCDVGGLECA